MRCCRIPKLIFALIAAAVILQCLASLALAVNEGWHEAIHHHGEEDDDDCPVVQFAHGWWDAPAQTIFAVPHPPAPVEAPAFPNTARQAPSTFPRTSALERGPPARQGKPKFSLR